MIGLKRKIIQREETNMTNKLDVKSSIIDQASVTIDQGSVEVKLRIPKNDTDVYDFDAPKNFIDVFGPEKVYKFLFTLLEQVTDMDKEQISSFLRSEPVAGHSMSQKHFEVLLEIPEENILSKEQYYR